MESSKVYCDEVFANNTTSKFTSPNIQTLVRTVFLAVAGGLQCLVAIPTNILNCLVFWRQGLRDRMTMCLFSLALVDCSYFTIVLAAYVVPAFIHLYDPHLSEEYSVKGTTSLYSVFRGFALTSGCINMVIAVDTCVCVVRPHRASSIMRTKTMAALIVSCFLLIQVACLINVFLYNSAYISTGDEGQWIIVHTEFYYENQFFVYLLQSILLESVIPFLNLTVVLVATIVTVRRLKSAIAWRENGSHSTDILHRQVALMKMLTIVASVFIVVKVPCVAFQVTWVYFNPIFANPTVIGQLTTTAYVIYTLSEIKDCFNFFIYFYRSSRFRQELSIMFSCAPLRNSGTCTKEIKPQTDLFTTH